MIHEMKLRRAPFATVASGTKVIEMRLWDEKRQCLQVGDAIRFTSVEDGASAVARIRALHIFESFEALYEALLPRFGAVGLGYAAGDRVSAADMLDYYEADAIARYGVVGIEIELI